MNRLVPLLPVLCSMLAAPVFAANNAYAMDDRLCNLQAREIALRISEEMAPDYTAAEREEISKIAEEVCQDYSAQNNSLPEINRPAAAQASPRAMPMSAQEPDQQASSQRMNSSETRVMATGNEEDASDSETEEENDSIIGGLKIIAPEDRVRRPGLKRR